MRIFFLLLFLLVGIAGMAQKPKNGTYTYSVAYAEWDGKSLGSTCTVIIKGDSVTVLHDGNKHMSGSKGDVLDKGILVKHKSGQWIIATKPEDKDAEEIGGCSEGPSIIDFKNKKWWTC